MDDDDFKRPDPATVAREIWNRSAKGIYAPSSAIEAFREAMNINPKSETSMAGMAEADNWKGFTVNPKPYPTKPEPTEDHLRRACEECELDWETYQARKYLGIFTYRAVRTVARLLAERDAMQARVEEWQPISTWPGTDEAYVFVCNAGSVHPVYACYDSNDDAWFSFNGYYEKLGKALKPDYWLPVSPIPPAAEPTPDPDLVLAREADEELLAKLNWIVAAREQAVRRVQLLGASHDTVAVCADELARVNDVLVSLLPEIQSALRALKLKGQAHDQ
jgi:hypothetical protein